MHTVEKVLNLVSAAVSPGIRHRGAENERELTFAYQATGDGHAAEMLTAQARTLDGIFAVLVNEAATSKNLAQVEAYMRLALKAQAQCARTVQVLDDMRKPGDVTLVQNNINTAQYTTAAQSHHTRADELSKGGEND